jgi:hypothetical protein
MRKRKLLGLAMAVALVVVACGGGPMVEAASAPAGSSIAVNGQWTISVYNQDGTLDRHVEFENAFQGESAITSWLSHQRTVGPWSISLYSADPSSWPCVNDAGEKRPCTIMEQFEPPQTNSSSANFTLSVTAEDFDSNGSDEALVLAGSITASSTGEISIVQTNAAACSADDVWPACTENEALTYTFTQKDLETAIPVTEGQLIEVEVVISFTTG